MIASNLSVVILTCNRPDDLEASLQSVLRQAPLPGQIVIMDDGRAAPPAAVEQARARGIQVDHHRKDRPGIARSRNLGAEAARGDLVMYLDDDERMEPGYIDAILRLMEDPGIIAAAGTRVLARRAAGLLDPVWNQLETLFLLRSSRHRILRSGFGSQAWDSFTAPTDVDFLSGTATYRRRVFERFCFDEELERLSPYSFGEDLAFSFNIRELGRRVVTPQANIVHDRSAFSRPVPERLAFQRLYNQYFIYSIYLRPHAASRSAFAWAVTGLVLLAATRWLAHPRRRSWEHLRGTLRGARLVTGMALTGGFRPLQRDAGTP